MIDWNLVSHVCLGVVVYNIMMGIIKGVIEFIFGEELCSEEGK